MSHSGKTSRYDIVYFTLWYNVLHYKSLPAKMRMADKKRGSFKSQNLGKI